MKHLHEAATVPDLHLAGAPAERLLGAGVQHLVRDMDVPDLRLALRL